MVSRRQFIGNASLLAFGPTIPTFLYDFCDATEEKRDEPILVVVQLTGGNDGLNTIVPFDDDTYMKARPTLRRRSDQVIKIADGVGLHSAMSDFVDVWESQRLAIIQGVGYPNPNRSHEISMNIWQTGQLLPEGSTNGWAGSALDTIVTTPSNIPDSIAVGAETLPLALRGRRSIASLVDTADAFSGMSASTPPFRRDDKNELSDYLENTASNAHSMAKLLANLTKMEDVTASVYPDNKFGKHLSLISQLIKMDLGSRIFYVSQEGYDTHAIQENQHAALLRNLSTGLRVFLDDLAAAGIDDKVLVLCFSEFGRQVVENASLGTDHGAAGPVLVAGKNVIPGLHGEAPDLGDLENNAPRFTTDFRGVYSEVIENWLHINLTSDFLNPVEKLHFIRHA